MDIIAGSFSKKKKKKLQVKNIIKKQKTES